ncbi:MAG: 30S ribosomal protein S6e [Candidatus Aenigmarchaeota archaeon]|nr:30S ribosomal protein S6e [Candidatus Aenigmarchaeota archaeon]
MFKFVISSGKNSWQIEKDEKDVPVLGKKIKDKISGEVFGLAGYEFEITGGSDKDGFPMRSDIEGTIRKRFLIGKGIGFSGIKRRPGKKANKPKSYVTIEGLRKKKTLRGNTIGTDIAQINCKVAKQGPEPIENVLGQPKSKGEPTPEAPKQ